MNSSTRNDLRMSPEEIDDLLRRRWWMVIGTEGPHGWPHLATVSYGIYEGRVSFVTFRKSQKAVNLERTPRISCLVEEGQDQYATIRGVQLSGGVSLHHDLETVTAVQQCMLRHQSDAGAKNLPDELQGQAVAGNAKRVAVILQPERTVSWDHRRLGGKY